MSHFTLVETKITDQAHLLAALHDLGYEPVFPAQGQTLVAVRGYRGQRDTAEVKVVSKTAPSYDIGFQQAPDGTYQVVADWWEIGGDERTEIQQHLVQRAAYHATVATLQAQGFTLVEETDERGELVLTLMR
jgi:hypothetical protein